MHEGELFKNGNKPLGFELREIHNLIKSVIHRSRPESRPEGAPLTQLQGGILGYLYHQGQDRPIYQKNIEEVFRISRATATNTLQVMEKNGLIVRKAQDKDGRLKRIFMTDEARCGHMRMERGMERMERSMLEGLDEEEIRQLKALLGRVRKNLERMNTESGETGSENQ